MKTIEMKPYRRQTWLKPELLHRAPSARFVQVNGNDGAQLEHPLGGPLTWVRCPHANVVGVERVGEKWHWLIGGNTSAQSGSPYQPGRPRMSQSIADTFIAVMGDLRSIEPESDDPMRYAMLGLRSEAEQIIGNAQQLAYSAKQLQRDCKDAVKEAIEAAASQGEAK